MDPGVQAYIDAISPGSRPLFDRLHRLILDVWPGAVVALAYQMPSYQVSRRRLYLGAWQHGVSLYGWRADQDGGFTARHPGLKSGRATIRLRPADAAGIGDGEFRGLIRAALEP